MLRSGTTILSLHAYEYDQVGNPVRVVQNGVQHYAVYDAKNQLTDWCAQDPCGATTPGLHYTYDPAGNRLTETRDGATTTYTYDNRNRLTAVTAADETVRQMEYDDAGRLIVDGERHYQYDVLGRLTSVTEPGNDTITYTYSADGLVSERTVGTSTTQFVWDTTSGAPRLLSESTAGVTVAYAYGAALLWAADGPEGAWAHTDRLGSTTSMTTDGATSASATYEPFGEFASNDGLGATSTFPSFAGTPTDPNSGLLLMGARAYDPSVGRFLTFDPAPVSAYDPAISPYVYVNNRPTVLVDPTGLRGANAERSEKWPGYISASGQLCLGACLILGVGWGGDINVTVGVGYGPDAGGSVQVGGGLGDPEGLSGGLNCNASTPFGGLYGEFAVGAGPTAYGGGGVSFGAEAGCAGTVTYTW